MSMDYESERREFESMVRMWNSLKGKKILVRVVPTIPWMEFEEHVKIYEVEVVDVSPSGRYVKFKGDINGWEPTRNWKILEVLG